MIKNENSAEKAGTETEDRAENVREEAKDASENVTETAENANGTVATVYNVGEIKENVPPSAKIIAVMGSKALGETFSDISIPQNQKKSTISGEKTKLSVKLCGNQRKKGYKKEVSQFIDEKFPDATLK